MPAVRLLRWRSEPELATVLVPEPGPGEILLKVEAAGLVPNGAAGRRGAALVGGSLRRQALAGRLRRDLAAGWRPPRGAASARLTLGSAGQLLGASDVGVTRVRWQRLQPPASSALALADTDLAHAGSRCYSAGHRRPRRPAQTGQASGHRQVRGLVRRDAPAIGKQRSGVLEHHDAVAEQAPSLFGMRRHHVGRLTIRCVRGRTGRLMLAHDALRSCPSPHV